MTIDGTRPPRSCCGAAHAWQADKQLLTIGNGSSTVMRVLQEKAGAEHGAYEWLPLRYAALALLSRICCPKRRRRWFKWLHATHPCDASKAWAISQGVEIQGERKEEQEGAGSCVVS